MTANSAARGISCPERDSLESNPFRGALERQLTQSQKMEAIGRLAGGIAHDFNNLLTAILGYADSTSRALKPEDELRGNVEQIEEAARQASALVGGSYWPSFVSGSSPQRSST